MKKITTALLLFVALNASAQFLSFSKKEIISLLGTTNHIVGNNPNGVTFIYVPNVSGCSVTYLFDIEGVCKKEIIHSSNPDIVDMVMDLNDTYYLKIGDVAWMEEPYGLVEVKRVNNTFTFAYK